jgi:hypothetical protein
LHATFVWFEELVEVDRALVSLNEAGSNEDNIGVVSPGRYCEEWANDKAGYSLGKKIGLGAAAGLSLGSLAGFLAGGFQFQYRGPSL